MFISMDGNIRKIIDSSGKTWIFEMNPQCGPVPVDGKTHEDIQIPNNSNFWKAVTHWAQQGQRLQKGRNNDLYCVWDKPKMPELTRIGGDKYVVVDS
jgi:hypothetical protein